MRIDISEQYQGMKLLSYLRGVVGISRAMLVRLKKDEKGILLNGSHVTVRAVLSAGDILVLSIEDTETDENPYLEAVEHPLDILYEDDDVVAVNKVAGMVTHTTHGHYGDSLANALYSRYKSQGRAFVFRAVNRLDRDTSGIVLVAKNRLTAHRLSESLKKGEIQKKYIAIVRGRLEGNGDITGYMCRCGDSIITRRVCSRDEEGAIFAHTAYKSLVSTDDCSIILASPITGRTHQLRVHFASIGHPIIGDLMYGDEGTKTISRQALHAVILDYPSASDGVRERIYAPLYEDMVELCSEFGIDITVIDNIGEISFD